MIEYNNLVNNSYINTEFGQLPESNVVDIFNNQSQELTHLINPNSFPSFGGLDSFGSFDFGSTDWFPNGYPTMNFDPNGFSLLGNTAFIPNNILMPFNNFRFDLSKIDFKELFTFKFPSFDFSTPANPMQSVVSGTGPLKTQVVNKAMSYVGKVNSDYEGNRLFSPKNDDGSVRTNWGWCCDFVTSVTLDVYGDKLPNGFKTSSPPTLKKWADDNDCYNDVGGLSESEKKAWIASNVKPGDIYIGKGSGPSGYHVAIVKSVNSDGTFTTVDGNSSDKVKVVNRTPSSKVYGFVALDKFAS